MSLSLINMDRHALAVDEGNPEARHRCSHRGLAGLDEGGERHHQVSSRPLPGSPCPSGSAPQVPGTIGIVGPAPNSSPRSVANPAACSPPLDAVPANPSGPAPRSEATVDATGSLPRGAPQSGLTSTFMS